MITIFGALGMAETERATVTTVGQQVVYDGIQVVFDAYNEDVEAMSAFFIQSSTSDYQIKYKLPGGGRLQRRGRQSLPAEVKGGTDWTVQLPLEDFGASMGLDDVVLSYSTVADIDVIVRTIQLQDLATLRGEILRAIFAKSPRPFKDELRGDLTVQPLANGDATLYPPVVGSEDVATSNHYLGVAASAVAFTDANNPIPTLVSTLEAHFGQPTGGSNIVVLVNTAQSKSVKGLADFVPVATHFVGYGDNVTLALEQLFPEGMPPGRVLGVSDGAIVVEWAHVPAGYMAAFHLDAPKPLIRRLDPADTGIPAGLHLFGTNSDAPLLRASYRNRYGLGAGNRLNGAIIDLTAATPNQYTTPAIFA